MDPNWIHLFFWGNTLYEYNLRETNTSPNIKYTIFHKDVSLIQLANCFNTETNHSPIPLRRFFTYLRRFEFESILCESRFFDNMSTFQAYHTNIPQVDKSCSCCRRKTNCTEYMSSSLDKSRYKAIASRECYKFYFFSEKICSLDEIISLSDDALMGYCVLMGFCNLHIDHVIRKENNGLNFIPYVSECISFIKARRSVNYIINDHTWNIKINDNLFKLKGNFFTQQNGITNCCAHASIKMALKGYASEVVTDRQINESFNKLMTGRNPVGGFTPNDFSLILSDLTGLPSEPIDMNSLRQSSQFPKMIYHAIESRFPVILLFRNYANQIMDDNSTKDNSRRIVLHSTTIIGHTFNRDNWWSYAWKSYFPKTDHKTDYLPSILWCDNFIIQDENFGLRYLLPVGSLKSSDTWSLLPSIMRLPTRLIRNVSSNTVGWLSPNLATRIRIPLHMVVVYPSEHIDLSVTLWLEQQIIKFLNVLIPALNNSTEVSKKHLFPTISIAKLQ